MRRPDKLHRVTTIDSEYQSLTDKETWGESMLWPHNHKLIGVKRVLKCLQDGRLDTYKVRLVDKATAKYRESTTIFSSLPWQSVPASCIFCTMWLQRIRSVIYSTTKPLSYRYPRRRHLHSAAHKFQWHHQHSQVEKGHLRSQASPASMVLTAHTYGLVLTANDYG